MITVLKDEYGEWVAVYKNGALLDEGHSISGTHMLELLDIGYECVVLNSAWVEDHGFPRSLPAEYVREGEPYETEWDQDAFFGVERTIGSLGQEEDDDD